MKAFQPFCVKRANNWKEPVRLLDNWILAQFDSAVADFEYEREQEAKKQTTLTAIEKQALMTAGFEEAFEQYLLENGITLTAANASAQNENFRRNHWDDHPIRKRILEDING
jgi:hypothetical protein